MHFVHEANADQVTHMTIDCLPAMSYAAQWCECAVWHEVQVICWPRSGRGGTLNSMLEIATHCFDEISCSLSGNNRCTLCNTVRCVSGCRMTCSRRRWRIWSWRTMTKICPNRTKHTTTVNGMKERYFSEPYLATINGHEPTHTGILGKRLFHLPHSVGRLSLSLLLLFFSFASHN